MDQNRGHWFSKATRLENYGQVRLVFRVMQGGVNGTPLFQAVIEPGHDLEVFGSDMYRNHSIENPVSAYVHLVGVGVDQSQYWTPLERGAFLNAKIRLSGSGSVEIPIEFQPLKGSKIGRLRVVVRLKKIMSKIRGFEN